MEERTQLRAVDSVTIPSRSVLPEEGTNPSVVVPRTVDLGQDLAVSAAKDVRIHYRDDVRRPVHVVSRGIPTDSTFAHEPTVELRAARGLEQPDHGGRDAAPLDEVDLPPEDRGPVVIESDDEPALHLEPGPLDPMHAVDQVTVEVSLLPTLCERLFVRCLDSDEDGVEARFDHLRHQLRVVREIDRGLGVERHPESVASHRDEFGQEFLPQVPPVPDQVVVDEEDAAVPAERPHPLELRGDLSRRLRARTVSEEARHTAELAVVRTASRVLDRKRCVGPERHELPCRNGGRTHVREVVWFVDRLGATVREVAEERLQDHLRLTQDEVIDFRERLPVLGEERSSRDDGPARVAASPHHFEGGRPLHDHPAHEYQVGPLQIAVRQLGYVEVEEPLVPVGGEERGDGREAQGRDRGLLADEAERVVEAPEPGRSFGIDQEDVHGGASF